MLPFIYSIGGNQSHSNSSLVWWSLFVLSHWRSICSADKRLNAVQIFPPPRMVHCWASWFLIFILTKVEIVCLISYQFLCCWLETYVKKEIFCGTAAFLRAVLTSKGFFSVGLFISSFWSLFGSQYLFSALNCVFWTHPSDFACKVMLFSGSNDCSNENKNELSKKRDYIVELLVRSCLSESLLAWHRLLLSPWEKIYWQGSRWSVFFLSAGTWQPRNDWRRLHIFWHRRLAEHSHWSRWNWIESMV